MVSGPEERAVTDASRPTVRRQRIDPARSRIGFRVRKMGLYFVKGRFRRAEGWVEVDEGGLPRRGAIEIEAASISTGIAPRDWHLRTRDFLDVGRHRIIRVKVDNVQLTDGELQLSAEFTFHGFSEDVPLYGHLHADEPAAALHLSGSLDRHAFGIRARPPVEWVVGRDVQIDALVALER
jgi:polyisoprenoid-binding protein YceI